MVWSRREIERVAYFFSASSLFIYVGIKYLEEKKRREDAQAILEGKPVIVDERPELEEFRLGGYKIGVFRQYDPNRGWITKRYTREEYLKKLEEEALERSREAQLKALKETGHLPEGSLVLVDPEEVKS